MDIEREREPSLDQLLRERDPWPDFYTPLSTMFEAQVRKLVDERNGR
jgi:hypothetical protein